MPLFTTPPSIINVNFHTGLNPPMWHLLHNQSIMPLRILQQQKHDKPHILYNMTIICPDTLFYHDVLIQPQIICSCQMCFGNQNTRNAKHMKCYSMFIPVRKLLQLKHACYIRADVSKYFFHAQIQVPSIHQYLCTKDQFPGQFSKQNA